LTQKTKRRTYCPVCMEKLDHTATGRPRRTCSDACKQAWYRLNRRVRGQNLDEEQKRLALHRWQEETYGSRLALYLKMGWQVYDCHFCGDFLPPYNGVGRPRRYCSDACRWKAWNVRHPGRATSMRKAREIRKPDLLARRRDRQQKAHDRRQVRSGRATVINLEGAEWGDW
jgi:hypothetical protein